MEAIQCIVVKMIHFFLAQRRKPDPDRSPPPGAAMSFVPAGRGEGHGSPRGSVLKGKTG